MLKESIAVIIGAAKAKSIGAAIARRLAAEGSNIIVTCRKNTSLADKLVQECREFGVEAYVFTGDATLEEFNQSLADFIKVKFSKIDTLINCLGITKSIPYTKLDLLTKEDFQEILSVNTIAPFLATQALRELLMNSTMGNIVNISATAGINGKGSSIPYAVSKGALNTLTLALAHALSPQIRSMLFVQVLPIHHGGMKYS
jgi:3-oxoacyl-[acyl-carrier protein] reductase